MEITKTNLEVNTAVAQIAVGKLTVINGLAPAANLAVVFKDGRRVLGGSHQGLELMPANPMLYQLEHDLALAGYKEVPVIAYVGVQANWHKSRRLYTTLGQANTTVGVITLYVRNILRRPRNENPFGFVSDEEKRRFFSVLAHEVGHLIDFRLNGDWHKTTALTKEERAEQYIRTRFGEGYVRPIFKSLYKG